MSPFAAGGALRSVRRHRRLSLIVLVVIAVWGLALLSSGCSAGVSEAVGTPAPESAGAASAPEAVWPYITVGQDPLFDLNVTEAPGFTKTEQDYLRGERIAWS